MLAKLQPPVLQKNLKFEYSPPGGTISGFDLPVQNIQINLQKIALLFSRKSVIVNKLRLERQPTQPSSK